MTPALFSITDMRQWLLYIMGPIQYLNSDRIDCVIICPRALPILHQCDYFYQSEAIDEWKDYVFDFVSWITLKKVINGF